MNALELQNRKILSATLAVFALLVLLTVAANAQKAMKGTGSADPAMDRPTAADIQNALPGREEQVRKETAAAQLRKAAEPSTDGTDSPPANDMFANAQVISGPYGAVGGTNVDATIEPGEPVGSTQNKTVWYRWTAPANLSITFETIDSGSLNDSVIGIYMGNAVGSLAAMAWNDDKNGSYDRHSRVTMIAGAGNVYYIQVRGFAELEGTFTLMWEINRAEQGKQFNFDGQNGSSASDFSVFRPTIGTWYIWLSLTQALKARQWGVYTDHVVPGDYDGDGGTDIAIWRPDTGMFYVLRSIDGTYSAVQWGISSDRPVQGDFDGDDHADLAVWRYSTGMFYVRRSSDGGLTAQQWGQSGDYLACGDYDGDGRTDFAIMRPATGIFYILRSSNYSFYWKQFGQSGDWVVPGDYDGDGKNDMAVYRYGNHQFYISRSSDGGFRAVQWGTDDDYLVPGDYAGGYSSDICVWRRTTGTFYCYADGGAGSFYGFQFGQNGDYPIASSNTH
jgi:hypothetical protein